MFRLRPEVICGPELSMIDAVTWLPCHKLWFMCFPLTGSEIYKHDPFLIVTPRYSR
jgi:hypothetical protein